MHLSHLLLLSILLSSSLIQAQFVPATMWKKQGKGYFVITANRTTGLIGTGGLAAANNYCLNDLTNNDWKGKTEAGTLNTARVRAFLCDSSTCQNALPFTEYVFASSGDVAAGGASFMTDSAGLGPGNSTAWSGLSYFNGSTYYYWTGPRNSTSTTKWASTSTAGGSCSNWGSQSVLVTGLGGRPASTDATRWHDTVEDTCNGLFYLICFVHPQ